MNILDQKMLLGINSALHQEKIDVQTFLDGIPLNEFFNKLSAHSVESLVYTALADPYNLDSTDKEVAQLWKKTTLFSTIYQQQHIAQMVTFFKSCNKEELPVIALKGLLLRDLYPIPNTRTMCDADILVHEKDINAIRNILLDLGYEEDPSDSDSDHHLVFSKPDALSIEVHWTLNTDLTNRNTDAWHSQIWNRCTLVKLGDTPILSLSLEDHLVFLCLHMFSHIKFYGFGIRQLCDFYLFIENYKSKLNWQEFTRIIKELNLSTFLTYIMISCQTLFNMSFPKSYNPSKILSSDQLDYFIDILLQGGVYGFENKEQLASTMLYHKDTDNRFKGFIKTIFPDLSHLSKYYPYVTNHIYLYPIAWLQNLWRLFTRSDFSLSHKFFIIFFSSKAVNQRKRLLKDLDS